MRIKSTKITRSARGRDCLVRIPGYCNHNNETTVPGHLNGGGTGTKHSDLFIAFICSTCHDVVDFRVKTEYSREQIELWHLQGMVRTQQFMLDKELVKLA